MLCVLNRIISVRQFFKYLKHFKALRSRCIILFLSQNICCGNSKEPSQWEGSLKQSKHVLKLMNKKLFTNFCLSKPVIFFLCNSIFHTEFSGHVLITSAPSRIEKYLANQKTFQQRDVYLNKHCRYQMSTSENLWVNVMIGYVGNFYR